MDYPYKCKELWLWMAYIPADPASCDVSTEQHSSCLIHYREYLIKSPSGSLITRRRKVSVVYSIPIVN